MQGYRTNRLSPTDEIERSMNPETVCLVPLGHTALNSPTETIDRGEIFPLLTNPWEEDTLLEVRREAFRYHAELRPAWAGSQRLAV